jgi:hypothetical protein
MDVLEFRLRCLEAAARNPSPHKDGYAAGVVESAQKYADWVTGPIRLAKDTGQPAAKTGEGVDSLF